MILRLLVVLLLVVPSALGCGTLQGDYSGSALVVTEDATIHNCRIENFGEAIVVKSGVHVVFDDVTIVDSVTGIVYEEGASSSGDVVFENVVNEKVQRGTEPEQSELPSFETPIVEQETVRRVVLFDQPEEDTLLFVKTHNFDEGKVRRVSRSLKLLEKYALVADETTTIIARYEALRPVQKFYVYEFGSVVYGATQESFDAGIVVPVAAQAAREVFEVTYVIPRTVPQIDDTPPITIVTTESPQWVSKKQNIAFTGYALGFVVFLTGGVLFLRRKQF